MKKILKVYFGRLYYNSLDIKFKKGSLNLISSLLNEPIENWNAIGKYWLSRLDIKFNETFFICKCSNVF
jgi:hypothetical protein